MKLILLRGDCDNGRTCPCINATDRGSYVVQGYAVAPGAALAAGFELLPGEAVVEIPVSLLPELAGSGTYTRTTERRTIFIRGQLVTDAAALAELAMPAGETAVEVPVSVFEVSAHA